LKSDNKVKIEATRGRDGAPSELLGLKAVPTWAAVCHTVRSSYDNLPARAS